MYKVRVRGRLELTRIRDSLLVEVPTNMAVLYEFARDSAHRADDSF
jgi:hypothetical protein